MEKINVLKLIEEQQETSDLFSRNLSKEDFMNRLYDFVDNYVKPRLIKLNQKNRIKYNPNSDDKETLELTSRIDRTIPHLLNTSILSKNFNEENSLDDIEEEIEDDIDLDNELDETKEEEKENIFYNLVYKDRKTKNKLADLFCEYLVRRYSIADKTFEFIDKYIVPILNDLNENKKISFDLDSKDEHTLLISKNTIELFKCAVCEESFIAVALPLTNDKYEEEQLQYLEFLFRDNEEICNEIASQFCDSFVENYKDIDLTNIKQFDSKTVGLTE